MDLDMAFLAPVSFLRKHFDELYTTEKKDGSGHYWHTANIKRVAIRKLEMLDVADSLNRLRILPSNRLEKLSGDRKGQHSVRINRQWRVCFHWERGHAYDVEIVDYHKG